MQKRHLLAEELGFSSFAEYILSKRMAKTPGTVKTFLEDLTRKLQKKGKEELSTLRDLKRSETGNADATLNSWDFIYYSNMLKEEYYLLNKEEIEKRHPEVEDNEGIISEYFPLDHVI